MEQQLFDTIKAGLSDGSIIPYLGHQALTGSVNVENGEPIPADSDSLILAMNNGRPMAPKLMYEFPRAAMNLELKRGRSFVTRFMNKLYGETTWTRAPLHDWIRSIKPACVIDINRDLQLQQSYSDTPHNLMIGIARIGGTDFRYKLYYYDGSCYSEISNEQTDPTLPLLLKPMGSPQPEANYIASDADYVDYITELMG
ncbi:MAG: SIR2 family protein, partial [Pseudomonadota bacterium]